MISASSDICQGLQVIIWEPRRKKTFVLSQSKVKEAAEDELEVGIRHFVREDGTVMGEAQMAWTIAKVDLHKGETLQAVAGYHLRIRRDAQALVDKIVSVNRRGFRNITNDLAGIQLQNAEELKCIVQVIFKKAIAEPSCVETCARLAGTLKGCYPDFPPESDSQKPLSFTRALLTICQEEFESMAAAFEALREDGTKSLSSEALQSELKSQKDMMLACMAFAGHLFLQRLLPMKVIEQATNDLIGTREDDQSPPEEHLIECVVELLTLVGQTLDDCVPHGVNVMNACAARLRDLARLRAEGKRVFSSQIRNAIHDLLDWRRNNWQPPMRWEHRAEHAS